MVDVDEKINKIIKNRKEGTEDKLERLLRAARHASRARAEAALGNATAQEQARASTRDHGGVINGRRQFDSVNLTLITLHISPVPPQAESLLKLPASDPLRRVRPPAAFPNAPRMQGAGTASDNNQPDHYQHRDRAASPPGNSGRPLDSESVDISHETDFR